MAAQCSQAKDQTALPTLPASACTMPSLSYRAPASCLVFPATTGTEYLLVLLPEMLFLALFALLMPVHKAPKFTSSRKTSLTRSTLI